jgi:LysR family pca operon transcriptional activator
MRVVDAIMTHRSLQKAAAALGLSQPALTKTLQELEDMLGARIFERHTRGVEPNRRGEAVVAAARRMLAEARRLEDELDAIGAASAGTIAIGALPVAAAGILPGALAALKERHPAIVVRLVQGTTEQLLPALAAGDIDLVIGRLYEPAAPDAFLREAIYDEPISVLARAGHPLLARAKVAAADLAAYPLVVPTITQRVGQEIERVLASLGLPAGGAPVRSSSVSLIREMLLTTESITVIPRDMLAGDIARGAVQAIAVAFAATPRAAGLIRAPAARCRRAPKRSWRACGHVLRSANGANLRLLPPLAGGRYGWGRFRKRALARNWRGLLCTPTLPSPASGGGEDSALLNGAVIAPPQKGIARAPRRSARLRANPAEETMADKSALVVSAHSADFVWRAGGAIALHAERGFAVKIICLSYGERGEVREAVAQGQHDHAGGEGRAPGRGAERPPTSSVPRSSSGTWAITRCGSATR